MTGANGRPNAHAEKDKEERKKAFLEAFAEHLFVETTCRKIKVAKSTIYKYRKEDAAFAEEWDEIDDAITAEIEKEAHRRAVEGVEKPIYQGGKKVGSVKQYSDRLLEMLLKARRPEKYRERLSIDDDREETRRRRELAQKTEEELDRELTGLDDNVIPIRRAS